MVSQCLDEGRAVSGSDPAAELRAGEYLSQLVEEMLGRHGGDGPAGDGLDDAGSRAIRVDQPGNSYVGTDHDPDRLDQRSAHVVRATFGTHRGQLLGRDLGGLLFYGCLFRWEAHPDALDGPLPSSGAGGGPPRRPCTRACPSELRPPSPPAATPRRCTGWSCGRPAALTEKRCLTSPSRSRP